jgi:hypothetical protein
MVRRAANLAFSDPPPPSIRRFVNPPTSESAWSQNSVLILVYYD